MLRLGITILYVPEILFATLQKFSTFFFHLEKTITVFENKTISCKIPCLPIF